MQSNVLNDLAKAKRRWTEKRYGNVKQKRKQQTTKCHTIICEPGSNKCTIRKPRLLPARSLEITECKPHGQHSHRFMDTIQKPARRCLVASDKKISKLIRCDRVSDDCWLDSIDTGLQARSSFTKNCWFNRNVRQRFWKGSLCQCEDLRYGMVTVVCTNCICWLHVPWISSGFYSDA